jgi:hypothetical protein
LFIFPKIHIKNYFTIHLTRPWGYPLKRSLAKKKGEVEFEFKNDWNIFGKRFSPLYFLFFILFGNHSFLQREKLPHFPPAS